MQKKITVTVSALVAILIATLGIVTFAYFQSHYKKLISNNMETMIGVIANEIDAKLSIVHDQLIAAGKTIPGEAFANVDTAQHLLDGIASVLPAFDNHIGLFSAAGVEITESPFEPEKSRRGMDFSHRAYIIETLKKREPIIADPYESSQAHKHPVIMMTVPIWNADKSALLGILAGSLDLTKNTILGDIGRTTIGKRQSGYIYLTTSDRTVVVHPKHERLYQKIKPEQNRLYNRVITENFEGTDDNVNYLGQKMITTFKRLRTNRWILGANYPRAEAYEALHTATVYCLLALSALTALTFVVTWKMVRGITAPLAALTGHVADLSAKTGDDRLIEYKSRDEIGTLANAFNKMIREIDAHAAALSEKELKYRRLHESMTDAYARTDMAGRIVETNNAFDQMLGYSAQEARQLTYLDLTPAKWHPIESAILKDQLLVRGYTDVYEKEYIRKNKTVFPIELRAYLIRDAGDRPQFMWALIRDITERKRLENQLRESQKMEGIGQLAGGVAHDFNNILTAMTIQINLAKSDPNLTAELREVFKELSDGTERAANLTRQLLMFGRRSVMEIKVLDLNRLVANLIKMLERIIGEQVNLRLDCLGKTPPIEADAGMIEQVLVNLTVNARDAMPLGGRISIMTEFRQINEEQARTDSNRRTGDFVCLSVVDTGCGMDEPTKKRIFEPFFTTKEAGKGTGLGLATVYGIVTQHKGWIEVESQPGKGTRFDIFLPASTQSVSPELGDSKPEGVPRGAETILLVEDEPAVRKMIGQFLTRLGYQVLDARNGLEAIKIWEEKWSVIDLLFSDMIMPEGLNGLDLALDFRKRKPGLKVIISSGYSPETTRQGKPDEGVSFLPKPFQPLNLGVVVRECLDRE